MKLISKLNARVAKDLLFITATAGAFLIVSTNIDALENFKYLQILQKKHLKIDIVILFLSFAFSIFSWRRWRELIAEVRTRKMLEKDLRKSEEKYKFLTENMDDIVWTLDRNFQTNYVSPSVRKVLGFTPEERKLQTLDEMVTPESLERIRATYIEEIEHSNEISADLGRSVKIEIAYYHKDGSIVWMENSVKAIRDPADEIIGFYGVSRDITVRKQAEELLLKERDKLKGVLAEIKTLSGLLPICSFCKKIRDDNGCWNQVESYIHKNSGAEFSHGVCPECAKKYYPDCSLDGE
ncbi:MAG: PAS domain S-box protein [Thermodesulfobacteriota bacterium]